MSFRSILSDVRDSIGSFSRRRGSEVRISGVSDDHRGKIPATIEESVAVAKESPAIPVGRWAGLPPELLRDVIKRLEESESAWPARKHVVACAAVCTAWREMCKEIVSMPEFCGKLTFPISLKQPGPREGTMKCFIKRDRSKSKYHLFLCLTPEVLAENGKFLLSAKRVSGASHTEYVISMDPENISRSSHCFVGKLRSNFLGTKFIIYESAPASIGQTSRRFYSKVSPKARPASCSIAQVAYELNVLGKRGPRRMRCTMLSIPTSAVGPITDVTAENTLDNSFRHVSGTSSRFSKSAADFGSARFSEIGEERETTTTTMTDPLVLRNKAPRWHEQLQCWCLNFKGRVTVASVKNFQLIADRSPEQDKIILQFGKVGKDTFTMDYRYPLSAFQAFAICLSSFDTKLACE